MEILNLPSPILLIEGMSKHDYTERKRTKTIKEWIIDYNKLIDRNRKKTNDAQFLEFVRCLLARTTYEGWWDKVGDWLQNEIKTVDNINEYNIKANILKNMGYRFHPDGAKVICEAKKVLLNNYDGDFKKYLAVAETEYENDFQNDTFCKIKNVKFKVRDFGLSLFSTKYIAIDSHILDILSRTGLICYCYKYNIEPRTDLQSKNWKVYLEMRKLCINISKMSNTEPGELDKILWYFGKSICKGKPLCNKCIIKNHCLLMKNKR